MINPANYYNPFAKYNYVSKTRGVYIPRDSEPLLKSSVDQPKSASIYSENYDAEADVMHSLDLQDYSWGQNNILSSISKFFGLSNN